MYSTRFIFPLLIAILLLFGVTTSQGMNELLSARCQSNCLRIFEENVEEEGQVTKRQLKHNIIGLCKSDQNCSACAKPCRQAFIGEENCIETHCQDSSGRPNCVESCKLLTQIYSFKAGSCPRPLLRGHAEECVTSCRRDGDCSNTWKCCRSGCGQRCIEPYDLSQSLLPIPLQVSVSERKRGRSVVVRWVMTKMLPEHLLTHSNLYVIQWKWAVSRDEEDMTHWQTITIKNKLYAILKHLLSPGRYYKFRVAAVNNNGSQGFSPESFPFKLSKDPKLPSRPRNLSKGRSIMEHNGLVSQEVSWLPPDSDLPIVHYKISWAKAPEAADLPHADMPRANKKGSASKLLQDEEFLTNFDHETEIVDALKTSVHLDNLQAGVKYIVEVQAIVKNEDDEELQGEKAAMYFVTSIKDGHKTTNGFRLEPQFRIQRPVEKEDVTDINSILGDNTMGEIYEDLTSSEEPTTTPSVVQTSNKIEYIKVHKPYFHNGLLKAQITWKLSDSVYQSLGTDRQYRLSWWPTVCMGASYPEFSLAKPLVAISNLPNFELYDLQYGCHYGALVSLMNDGTKLEDTETETAFETPMCQDTPVKGELPLNCPDLPPDVPSPPTSLHCSSGIQRNIESLLPNVSAKCTWDVPFRSDKPITGYRLILGQKLVAGETRTGDKSFPAIDRNTVSSRVLEKEHRFIQLHGLLIDTEYVVQIQAASEVGVGPAVFTTFPTPGFKDLAEFEEKLEEETIIYQTEKNPNLFHDLNMKPEQRTREPEPKRTNTKAPKTDWKAEISDRNSFSSSSTNNLSTHLLPIFLALFLSSILLNGL